MKLWQKYLFYKLFKTFFFLLACLVILYMIVDLSAHGVRFFATTTLKEIGLYYASSLCQTLNLFLSLTFLLSSLRVLLDLSSHRELIALQMAGISKKALLFPFFLFASLLATLSYANDQWLIPHTEDTLKTFKASYKQKKRGKEPKLFTLALSDDSEIVYHSYDKDTKLLKDVFWIESPDQIWHMKTLCLQDLQASCVDCFFRNQHHLLEKSSSEPLKSFQKLKIHEGLITPPIPYEYRPLFSLLQQAFKKPSDTRSLFSHFYYKLASPFIPFLILIGIGPTLLSYSRRQRGFWIASVAIFALLALKTILDGTLILGENQVIPSYLAVMIPILLFLLPALPAFMRMR